MDGFCLGIGDLGKMDGIQMLTSFRSSGGYDKMNWTRKVVIWMHEMELDELRLKKTRKTERRKEKVSKSSNFE